MSITSIQLQSLIEAELASMRDVRVISHIKSLLVEPTEILRGWDYGTPGQVYPCWAVLNHIRSNTGIAYCEFGFGPKNPWGLVTLSGSSGMMSMGMDSGWFKSFIQAYFDSMAVTDLAIWRVFKSKKDEAYPGVAITEDADSASTWKEVYRLRAADPDHYYACHHSIQLH